LRNEYLPADGHGSFNQSAYTLLYRSESGPIGMRVSQNEPHSQLFLFLIRIENDQYRITNTWKKKKKRERNTKDAIFTRYSTISRVCFLKHLGACAFLELRNLTSVQKNDTIIVICINVNHLMKSESSKLREKKHSKENINIV